MFDDHFVLRKFVIRKILMSNSNLYIIDLFSGAGGLSEGLKQSGFSPVFANEYNETFLSTYKNNNKNIEVSSLDIRSLDPKKIRKSLGLSKGEVAVIAGGPPCQGFSINAPVRSNNDKRNHLFLDYIRFVKEFLPYSVIIENVPGIISFSSGETVRSIRRLLENLGYRVDISILCAAHYGVPQGRWRTIIVGTRDLGGLYRPPEIKFDVNPRSNFTSTLDNRTLLVNRYSKRVKPFVSVEDAIFDLPEIENQGGFDQMDYCRPAHSLYAKKMRVKSKLLLNHKCASLGPKNIERIRHIPPGGSWRDIPFDLLPEGMKRARRTDHTKRYGRLCPKSISSTILTKPDPHWGAFIHPTQPRVLSIREAARLQSFPDRYVFNGSLSNQYVQVGNAVPPLLAKEVGLALKKQFNSL